MRGNGMYSFHASASSIYEYWNIVLALVNQKTPIKLTHARSGVFCSESIEP